MISRRKLLLTALAAPAAAAAAQVVPAAVLPSAADDAISAYHGLLIAMQECKNRKISIEEYEKRAEVCAFQIQDAIRRFKPGEWQKIGPSIAAVHKATREL